MADINDSQKKGVQSPYSRTSPSNALQFAIKQQLRKVQTTFVAKIVSCDGQEEHDGSGRVSAIPLVAQTDAEHNALPMSTLIDLPYPRVQQGIAALIIDPVPGDIAVFSVTKNDSTAINSETTDPQPPASLREFSQSDAHMVCSIHTKKPEVWILIKQDRTIKIHAPQGCVIETDQDCEINCGQNCKITAGANCDIDAGADCTVKAGGAVSVKATGAISLASEASISLEAPQIQITGQTTITGNLTQGGSGGGGSATFQGSMSATGNIHSAADITAGSISLTGHHHTCPDGQTGPAQA